MLPLYSFSFTEPVTCSWVLSAKALRAGVGVAGMFTWFSNGLVMMAKMGGQVKIGHCLGAGDDDDARRYLGAALKLGIVFALFFGIGINILAHSLIGFFQFLQLL